MRVTPIEPPASSMASSTTATATDLPADILNCIQKSLPLDDYLRFPAICTSWRSAAKRIAHQPFPDTEFPWLFSLRPLNKSRSEFATAVSLSPDKSRPPEIYSIPVPQPFQGHTVISADAHCLMIEYASYRGHNNSGIYLVNPFDSWSQLGLLPSSSTISKNPSNHPACHRILRIAMNNTAAVAMWGLSQNYLAYTRLGFDHRWIDLRDIVGYNNFEDVATYKDGLFYAVDRGASKIIALDFSSPTVRLIDMTLNLPAYQESNGWTSFQHARLVSSSSGLFLVRWRNLIKVGEKKRREIDVYKLMDDDDAAKKWAPIKSLGNLSFFLGTKSLSVSLSTTDFPRLRSNCIYIPHDANMRLYPENYSVTVDLDEDDDNFRPHLIYNLGDKSWAQYFSDPYSYFNGFWMTPRLL